MAAPRITEALISAVTAAATDAIGAPVHLDPAWRPPVQGAVGHLLGLRVAGEARDHQSEPLVVKVFPAAAEERAATEAHALRIAGVLGDLVPRLVARGRSDDGMPFVIVNRLPGARWADRRPGLSAAEERHVVAEVGAIAGRLHAVTGPHFGALIDTGPDTAADAAGTAGERRPGLRSWTDALVEGTVAGFRAAGGEEELAAGIERLAGTTPLDEEIPPSFCHQDLNGGNVLLRHLPGTLPAISGVVDLERAEWGDPMHDLALTVIHLMHERESGLVPALLDAHGGIDDAARARLRLHVVLRMASEWAWVTIDRPADRELKTATLAAWIRERV
ncbi:aminoglycoside phosphotransferase family protein [Tersicoccus sp. MR15.9]|uniref:phosphotransferase family protein n=1 Tax=Tersicoccus mangrovi TaxID=3121635 RepID=UPI002FE5E037